MSQSASTTPLRILATSSCSVPVANLKLGVFQGAENKFFSSVNGKFLGTFQSEDAATKAVAQHVQTNCEFLKRRVLMY